MTHELSEDDLQELVNDIVNDSPFTLRNAEYENRLDLLYGRRKVELGGIELKTQFRWPEPLQSANQLKNRMLKAGIKINIAARSAAERSRDRARAMEAFAYRHYNHWRDLGVFDVSLFDMATLGIGWRHMFLNRDLIPELPAMEKDETPEAYMERARPEVEKFQAEEHPDLFGLEPVAPAAMYWTQGMGTRIHAALVPYNQAADTYAKRGKGLNIDGDGNVEVVTLTPGEDVQRGGRTNWNRTVTIYTVSDADYTYQLIKGKNREGKAPLRPLGCWPNLFGRPAFFPVRAEITGSSDPLTANLPLIEGLYRVAPYMDIAYNAKLSAGVDAARRTMTLKKIDPSTPDFDQGALEIREIGNGVIMAPDGYEFDVPNIVTGPDLRDAIELIRLEGQGYKFSSVLAHPEEAAASSGYQYAQQKDAVSSLLDPPLAHHASTLSSEELPALFTGVRNLGVDVTVRNVRTGSYGGRPQQIAESVTLRAKDVMDADISVEFSSITMFTRLAETEEGIKLLASDLMNETWFYEQIMGVDDAEAVREQQQVDKVEKAAAERATTDVLSAIDKLRGQIEQEAADAADINPLVVNSDLTRPDRGASVPIGPGAALPIQPTPPGQGVTGQAPAPAGGMPLV